MTGGGIYAVNKLAKASESRHQQNSNSNQQSRDQSYSPQPQSRSPPSNSYQTRDAPYNPQEARGEGYWVPAPSNPAERAAYEREKWEREQFEEWKRQQSPPQYVQARDDGYQSQGDQVYERRAVENGNGSNTSLGRFTDMAMGFVEGQGQNGTKGGKGDLVGKLFSK